MLSIFEILELAYSINGRDKLLQVPGLRFVCSVVI